MKRDKLKAPNKPQTGIAQRIVDLRRALFTQQRGPLTKYYAARARAACRSFFINRQVAVFGLSAHTYIKIRLAPTGT